MLFNKTGSANWDGVVEILWVNSDVGLLKANSPTLEYAFFMTALQMLTDHSCV